MRPDSGCRDFDVDPAFQFLALPAARAGVGWIERERCARLAADARVAEVVEGQQRDGVLLGVGPDGSAARPRHLPPVDQGVLAHHASAKTNTRVLAPVWARC